MTTGRVRIAAHLRPGGVDSYARWRAAVVASEQLGADMVFGYDHFHRPSVVGLTPDGRMQLSPQQPDVSHFEAWTAVASWGEVTRRAEIGVMVSGAGYRNPDLLADMARTVDHISGGRLILGVGAGWYEKDYSTYGFEFGTVGDRHRTLEAALERITRRLRSLNPAPLRAIPILLGGGGEKRTIPLVAQYADIWHVPAHDPDMLQRKYDIMVTHAEARLRNPCEIEIAVDWPGTSFVDGYFDAGARIFVVGVDPTPDYDLSALKDAIAWRDSRL